MTRGFWCFVGGIGLITSIAFGQWAGIVGWILVAAPADEVPAHVRVRQANCKHSFIRGACDTSSRCPHCGISQADYERLHLQPFGGYTP